MNNQILLMKRILKWVSVVVGVPLALLLVLMLLLYIPFVQDFAVRQATAIAEEATGWHIRMERLRLRPLMDLGLQGLVVTDAEGDTLVAAHEAVVDLDFTQLFKARIGVDAISLNGVDLNTKDMIAEAKIRGRLEALTLRDEVSLSSQRVNVDIVEAHGLDVDIALQDTTVVDTTTSEPVSWTLALAKVCIEDARIRFAMAGDSAMTARAVVHSLEASEALLDLEQQRYTVAQASLQAPQAALWLTGDAVGVLPMRADSLTLTASAIDFDGMAGHVALPDVKLTMPQTQLTASADLDLAALEPSKNGMMNLHVSTRLSKQTLVHAAGELLPEAFSTAYPDVPLHIGVALEGNVDQLDLTNLELALPGSFIAEAKGSFGNVLDSLHLQGKVDFNARTQDLRWLRKMADGALDGILLPPVRMNGTANLNGAVYGLQAQLMEADALVNLRGQVNLKEPMSYEAKLQTLRLNLRHFMPDLATSPLTMTAEASGRGTDVFDHHTRIEAQAEVQQLSYDSLALDHTTLQLLLTDGRGTAHLQTNSPILTAQADVSTLLRRDRQYKNGLCDITFGLDLSRADLKALGVVEQPVTASVCLHMDGRTNLQDRHFLMGSLNDIVLLHEDSVFRPEDVDMEVMLAKDTTYVTAKSGDMSLRLSGHTGYERLIEQLDHFMAELNRQVEQRRFQEEELVQKLPQVDLRLQLGQHNIIHNFSSAMGYDFDAVRFGMNLDPLIGINGGGHIYKLNLDGMQLDTLQAHIYQDSTSVRMDARVRNGRRNPQFTFDSRLNASLNKEGVASAQLVYFDEKGKKGIDLGFAGKVANDTLYLHLTPLSPIIAYRQFSLNKDNYVMLSKGNHVDADIDLKADDGTRLNFYSTPNAQALQDLTVSVNRFNLGELSSVLPYLPRLGGFLHGDAHLIVSEGSMSVSTDMAVDDLRYEQADLGQVGLQAVYLPNADGSHFVDGSLLQMGMPVATFSGTYTPRETDGLIDVDASLDRLPFSMANGFIPDAMARLEGVAIGDIHVGGTTDKPDVDGRLTTAGLRILSDPYSLNLRVQDDTITIQDSYINLNRIHVYSTGSNPFVMDGTIDFHDTEHIVLNTSMNAKDFELINAKKTTKSIAYGKVFVDFNSEMKGTLDDLNITGNLKVLGKTNVTYLLTDSPLSADDQLSDLVEFVDFTDSLYVEPEVTERPQHIRVRMNIGIDDAAVVHCLLSPDGSSYVNLEGGGDLMMTYSPDKDLQLSGRYTINHGSLKYTMMVIPLKEFTIKTGSYAEFRGPLMNPVLNLSATENIRTTITENEQPRSVNFEVGMNITRSLQDLGLEFTLDAPEDSNIQNELSTMSAEQRGRLAVTMLATGMYINDAGALTAGGVTGQNALNAFLQSQISNLTSKALKSVDLSMGVEQGTSTTGATTTDYSFRFAKRLWSNRVSIIVGGKVSTGENATNSRESMIDNVSIEYRLDQGGSRSVNVFYDKNYESLLDGEITEMGAGLVLRKKTLRWGELFLFKK